MNKQVDKVNQSSRHLEGNALDLIHTVMHLYRSRQYEVLRDGPHQITHMESKVLGYFSRYSGATQSDLAKSMGRDKAQLARLIKSLRDRKLLTAKIDESDRRNVQLAVTAEGQFVLNALHGQSRKLSAKAVVGLDASQRQQLIALLQHVRKNLER
jgi:DNA-binding MarR family transcriptional regulator